MLWNVIRKKDAIYLVDGGVGRMDWKGFAIRIQAGVRPSGDLGREMAARATHLGVLNKKTF
jgi:hypothetical protein